MKKLSMLKLKNNEIEKSKMKKISGGSCYCVCRCYSPAASQGDQKGKTGSKTQINP